MSSAAPGHGAPTVRFGSFSIDPQDRVLRRNGDAITLTPKAFDILMILVNKAGRVVRRQELFDAERCWRVIAIGSPRSRPSWPSPRLRYSWRDESPPRRGPNPLPFFRSPTTAAIPTTPISDSPLPRPSPAVWETRRIWRPAAWARCPVSPIPPCPPRRRAGSCRCSRSSAGRFSAPPTPEAYEEYAKGRFLWNRRTDAELRKSIDHYKRAIQLDPNYAAAWAGLADSTMYPGMDGASSSRQKALSLDDTLAEAHAGRGQVYLLGDYNFPLARKEIPARHHARSQLRDGTPLVRLLL